MPTTFIAVTIALGLTSTVVARWGDVPLGRAVARKVAVGRLPGRRLTERRGGGYR